MKPATMQAMLQSINDDPNVQSLVQSSPVCHKVFDPQFKLRFMSQSGMKALKINNIEPYYGHVFPTKSAPKSTRDIVSQYMRRAAEGEENTIEYSFEIEGQVVWFRTTIIPYFNGKGELIYITGDSMDITSTIKSEETNRTLLETTDICLKEIQKNVDGSGFTLVFMSSAGQSQLGLSNVESLYGGPYPPDFYPQGPKKTLIEALHYVVDTGKSIQVESELVDLQGQPVWYLSTFSVQRKNEAGEVISITGSSVNVTEKIQSQVNLAKSKEEAERANKAKSEFLSRMSHELRTPLNAILGFSQLMQINPDQSIEQRQIGIGHILDAGNHLLKLVDGILDLSKIEAGKFCVAEEDLNASLLISKLIAQIQPSAQQRKITILNQLSLHDDFFIRADKTAFNQIILNLLNNAVKYNDKAGSITIDGGESGNDEIWFSVSDTGPGIDSGDIEALFEPFNRLGQEFTGIEGTGIGLSLCKMLVELLGGSIAANCESGNGCCFKVILPKGNRESLDIEAAGTALTVLKEGRESTGRKILYIEDNHCNLVLVKQILQAEPQVKFLSAVNPKDGIALARTQLPDLILMDIQLPQMDGITAFRELQTFRETRNIPVIAVSAQAMQEDIQAAMNAGFKGYITKPFDVKLFLSKIDSVLN
ncbi:MAG: response regulator [Algicola sp.]|nr:response regulator [Algicola sp.]